VSQSLAVKFKVKRLKTSAAAITDLISQAAKVDQSISKKPLKMAG
jgi:hypothetical protein